MLPPNPSRVLVALATVSGFTVPWPGQFLTCLMYQMRRTLARIQGPSTANPAYLRAIRLTSDFSSRVMRLSPLLPLSSNRSIAANPDSRKCRAWPFISYSKSSSPGLIVIQDWIVIPSPPRRARNLLIARCQDQFTRAAGAFPSRSFTL